LEQTKYGVKNQAWIHEGKERNRDEFKELVGKAGLEMTKVWTLGGVESYY
jgi:hypothetical protein